MSADLLAAIAGSDDADEASERLNAAGFQATVDGDSVVIDGGQLRAAPFEGVNQIGDHFFLWCITNDAGELQNCVARGKLGSCHPRH